MASERYADAVRRIDAFAHEHLRAEGVPGAAVALTDDEGPIAELAYGLADVARGRPVEPDTVFPIASVAKAFTAACVLAEAADGRVGLDDPVARHLAWLPLEGVTLRHLLTHTAGIISGLETTPSTAGDARTLLGAPRGAPGERFHYSNVGYAVLGLALAAATGRPYEGVVRDRLLRPLRMSRSSAIATQAMALECAVGHRPVRDDEPYVAGAPLAPAPWIATDSGAGSACCPAGDLAAFLRMLMRRGDGVLTEDLVELMTTPGVPGAPYGHGLAAFSEDGRRLVGHDGDAPGFQSHMWADAEAGVGVVVLWNGPGSTWSLVVHALAALRAARAGTAIPPPPPEEAPPPPVAAAGEDPREGTYRCHSPWIPSVRIVAGADGLVLVWPWGEEAELAPVGPHEYRVGEAGSPERARFADAVDGRPLSVLVSGQRFDRTPW